MCKYLLNFLFNPSSEYPHHYLCCMCGEVRGAMFVGCFSFSLKVSYIKVKNVVFLESKRQMCDLRTTVCSRI